MSLNPRGWFLLVLTWAIFGFAPQAYGQHIGNEENRFRDSWQPLQSLIDQSNSNTGTALAAVAGSASGFLVGALAGYRIERELFPCGCEDPGLIGGMVGAIVGSAFVSPLAVRIITDHPRPGGRVYAVAGIIAAVGIAGSLATANSSAALVFLVGSPIAAAINAAR